MPELTQTAALEQSTAISTALNDAIDNGLLKVDLKHVYSLQCHFQGILKIGKTPAGNDGFKVDESIQELF